MQQMFRCGLAGIFLLICTFQDMKTGKISGYLILLFGIVGIIVDIIFKIPWQMCISGILPGLGILVFGKLSKEQIGYGDGFVMSVMGLFLSGRENISLFLTALFLCSLCTIILFLKGKIRRQMTFPFLPFLTIGFVIYVLSVYFRQQ